MKLGDLSPDLDNPRFSKSLRASLVGEDAVFDRLADDFNALALAESIARHGYFVSEPMIATEEEGKWVVLEGNRRLTALYGLAREDLRQNFDDRARWEEAAASAGITMDFELPVIVADSRGDADEVIGFRHIGGVLQWSPVQRAQFLARMIDEQGQSFTQVADSVGEEVSIVKMLYRNQAIIEEAEDGGEAEVAASATERFGIFTNALNRTTLRDYVGAVSVPRVEERVRQLPDESLPFLVELSSWLFGDREHTKVISESREIGQLATVVGHDDAREELQRTRNLESALDIAQSAGDPDPAKVMKGFATGVGHLRTSVGSIELIAMEPRAVALSEELEGLTEEIVDAVDRAQA